MVQPAFVIYLSAGAYIAIMLAVLGVPQLLPSYFDLKTRRLERQENEASAERRHQEIMAAEARREERQEDRQEERRREELDGRRRDAEMSERRHQELMALLVAALSNGGSQGNG